MAGAINIPFQDLLEKLINNVRHVARRLFIYLRMKTACKSDTCTGKEILTQGLYFLWSTSRCIRRWSAKLFAAMRGPSPSAVWMCLLLVFSLVVWNWPTCWEKILLSFLSQFTAPKLCVTKYSPQSAPASLPSYPHLHLSKFPHLTAKKGSSPRLHDLAWDKAAAL